MKKNTCTHPEGCDRLSKNKEGPCGMHLERLRTKGKWGPVGRLASGPKALPRPRIGYGGYVYLWAPGHPMAMADGYVMEHRMVMYDEGVDPTGYHVHHVNHDKTDNRFENLERKTESDHHREHIQEAGFVVNQFGTWPLRSLRAG